MKKYDDTFTYVSRKELRSNLGTERKKTWVELTKTKNIVKNPPKKESAETKWN